MKNLMKRIMTAMLFMAVLFFAGSAEAQSISKGDLIYTRRGKKVELGDSFYIINFDKRIYKSYYRHKETGEIRESTSGEKFICKIDDGSWYGEKMFVLRFGTPNTCKTIYRSFVHITTDFRTVIGDGELRYSVFDLNK